VGRHVRADAAPIIILWPFGPIRLVYELEDTGPEMDRSSFKDPFAATGKFQDRYLERLMRNSGKERLFGLAPVSWRGGSLGSACRV
jgi:hypothetical protein